nr:MAG TPA: hypothetical protein [Caudoviricetes sp.]
MLVHLISDIRPSIYKFRRPIFKNFLNLFCLIH